MKLKNSDFKSDIFGAEQEMDFSVDTSSSVIFDILRDKMYTNKVAAVCREVSSNSRDANIEAGRGEVPIKISIIEPFELDCISDKSIVFSDCGLGITPDRMADVFVKYAASTKRQTDDEVGGFGLGAKTPFAYSDTFTVITVCDVEEDIGVVDPQSGVKETQTVRMRYVYTAMIDDTQRGKMVLFESEESEEDTGTQIVVPFNDSDRLEFEKEIHRATSLWSIRPDLEGTKYDYSDIPKVVDEEGLTVLHDKDIFFNSTFLAVIEGIPYKLDSGLFKDKYGDILTQGLGTEYPIALYFRTGELDISANREGIHYTDDTKKVIESKLDIAIGVLEQKVYDTLKVEDDWIETCIRVQQTKEAY